MSFLGWRVLGALWLVAFIAQGFPNYGAAVINAAMAAEWELERSTLGLGFTLFMLAQGGAAPLAAWLIKRWGVRATLAVGGLGIIVAALGLALFATREWHYLLLFGVLMGVGCAVCGMIPMQAGTAQWFVRRRGLAMAIVMTASSLGGFVAAPLLAALVLASGDWRMGWYCVALVVALAMIVTLCWVRSPALGEEHPLEAEPLLAANAPGRRVYRSSHDWSLRSAAGTSAMWLSVNAAIAFSIISFCILAHLVPHLTDLGHPPRQAALALGCMSLAGVIGKLVAGYCCDRIEPRLVWFLAMLMAVGGLLLMVDVRSEHAIYLISLLIGLGCGACILCWAAQVANCFGSANFATVMGGQVALMTPLSAATPYLIGLSFDYYGSYTPAFVAVSIYGLASAISLLWLRPPQRPIEQAPLACMQEG